MHGNFERCIFALVINQTNKIMIVFANLSNGDQMQIKVIGDQAQIMAYVSDYEGDDLGNDLICEDFVTDFKETGVTIHAN